MKQKSTKTTTMTFRVSKDLKLLIRKMARADKITPSAFVERLLAYQLSWPKGKEQSNG